MDDIEKKMQRNINRTKKSRMVGQLLTKLCEESIPGSWFENTSWTVRVDWQGDLIIRVYSPGVVRLMKVMEIIQTVGLHGYYFDGDRGRKWMEIVVFMDRW